MAGETYDFREFRWLVHASGYQWVESGRLLVPEPSDGSPPREYFPLRGYTGLFRTFANVEPDQCGIEAFASEYGFLGLYERLLDRLARKWLRAESIDIWQTQIRMMRQAVDLWDMVYTADKEALAGFIEWQGDDRIWYNHPDLPLEGYEEQRILLASQDLHPEVLRRCVGPGDLVQPALHRVNQLVNKSLDDHTRPQLRYAPNRREGLYLVPKNLIGALWLQLAWTVAGEKEYRQCLQCNAWFEISKSAHRSNRRYCTDACKSKARRRKEKVRELYTSGLSIKTIAKKISVDPERVRSWVKGAKR